MNFALFQFISKLTHAECWEWAVEAQSQNSKQVERVRRSQSRSSKGLVSVSSRLRGTLGHSSSHAEAIRHLVAAFVFLLATSAFGQDFNFLFDANGDLLVQAAATIAPPQILGQPQNRTVAPGESASLSVAAADTRFLNHL